MSTPGCAEDEADELQRGVHCKEDREETFVAGTPVLWLISALTLHLSAGRSTLL